MERRFRVKVTVTATTETELIESDYGPEIISQGLDGIRKCEEEQTLADPMLVVDEALAQNNVRVSVSVEEIT